MIIKVTLRDNQGTDFERVVELNLPYGQVAVLQSGGKYDYDEYERVYNQVCDSISWTQHNLPSDWYVDSIDYPEIY